MQEIANLASNNQINLFFTEITINEIKSNFKGDLSKVVSLIKNFKRDVKFRNKVIHNLKDSKQYLDLPFLDLDTNYNQMTKQMQLFLRRSKATVIPYSDVDLPSIMSKYFKQEQPFGPGKKKSEFPDAIVFSALQKWCDEKDEKMYLVTADGDFSGLTNKNIIIEKSFPNLLDKINKYLHQERYSRVDIIYQANVLEIEDKIKAAFLYRIKDEIGFDITIGNIEIIDFSVDDYTITDLSNPMEATIDVTGNVSFALEVTYMNYTDAFYDKEDDRYIGGERSTVVLENVFDFKAEIFIEADLSCDESTDDFEITCTKVNAPNEDDITEELDGYIFQL